ncbi:hypothetical protein ELY21_07450 [Legionella sp. km535]|uniref:LepB GTPase-activating domain-containing protein n=1 Tax=Legionella sp. km535 TaxID=2498107 RepID=UPI000F8DE7EE|nr:LepB GTPase-activating domain-containing protein [Legionella sp. km535]RUR18529.1 hypothetical protein ELY21_07450 [Legionella sp. km535]
MPTLYQGKELTRYKEKSGGKNNSNVDGFYKNTDNELFFIKKPADKSELFAELFAGLLLNEFKSRQIISEVYFPSLICADVIQFEDQSYGLIQPLVDFDELHKIIGTSYRDGSDRDPLKEALSGPDYYTTVTKLGESFGLSMALMFSLLLGAHSVHSGNIVVLKGNENSTSTQFGRIDWGDAFRNFAHKDNNSNILYAYENRGIFNYRRFTKDYFLNFKKINGLFPAMAEKAKTLLPKLPEDILLDIVVSALKKIPADLLDQTTKNQLAGYMFMPSFKEVQLGPEAHVDQFATEMAQILEQRMNKISELKDFVAQEIPEHLYASVIHVLPYTLTSEGFTSFPEIIKHWSSTIKPDAPIDLSGLNLSNLAQIFNQYVSDLALKCEATNQWAHSQTNNANIFQPYYKGQGEQIHGHAFVPQYKESTIVRRLFSVDSHTLNTPRFAAFEHAIEQYTKEHHGSAWTKIQTLLGLGQELIMLLNIANQIQKFGMDEEISQNILLFKTNLTEFLKAEAEVRELLDNPQSPFLENPVQESHFFYPIDNMELNQMTGDQLATIYLEEMNGFVPNPLIIRIIKNDALWLRMSQSFNTAVFNPRLDNPVEKITKAHEWRQLFEALPSEDPEKINSLMQQINEQESHSTQLNEQILTLQTANTELQSEVKKEQKAKIDAEQSAQKLSEELELQKRQIEQLHLQLAEQDRAISELQQQNAVPSILSTEEHHSPQSIRQNEQDDAIQHQLKTEITQLQNELKKRKTTANPLEELVQADAKAQQKYDIAMEQNKPLHFARLERMAPVLIQIENIEMKAASLVKRKETKAANAAFALASQIRTEMKLYAENQEPNEQIALNDFKIKAGQHINASKEVLNHHREEWKYILANVAVGILLLGIGYAAALLINKQVTGHYTFFNKTDSVKLVDQLNESIVAREIKPGSGG